MEGEKCLNVFKSELCFSQKSLLILFIASYLIYGQFFKGLRAQIYSMMNFFFKEPFPKKQTDILEIFNPR